LLRSCCKYILGPWTQNCAHHIIEKGEDKKIIKEEGLQKSMMNGQRQKTEEARIKNVLMEKKRLKSRGEE
jgi:hypothetical protein